MQIIIPKRYVGIMPVDIVIFLAGPVLGGGDWQREVIKHFIDSSTNSWSCTFKQRIFPRLKFVVPCRWGESHPLAKFFASQYSTPEAKGVEAGQTYWEIQYLLHILKPRIQGRKNGFVFFGLFPEDKIEPRKDGVPYATDTRGELGRYETLAKYEETRDSLFVGAHPDFILGATMSNLQYFSSEWLKSNWREINSPRNLADWIARVLWDEFVKQV